MQQDFREAVSDLIQSTLNDIVHTSAAGKINSVEKNHTAKLTPDLKISTDDGREVPYPKLHGVKIIMPCGAEGKIGFAFPVKGGDGALALFGEGGSGTDLKFDLSNATALPGLYDAPSENVQKAGDEEAAIIFAYDTTIVVKKDKVEVTRGNTKITADDSGVTVNATSVDVNATTANITASATTITGTTTIKGNVTVTGNETVNGILTAGGINMNTHTHTCASGESSTPH